jgi:hypothetical protein
MGAAAADRDAQEAALKARIARIESAQNSKILGLEDVPANPDDPATQAYRARIRAREPHRPAQRRPARAPRPASPSGPGAQPASTGSDIEPPATLADATPGPKGHPKGHPERR